MKKWLILIALLFLSGVAYSSYIFNPGTGGPTTLTDANGCIWNIGNSIDTNGIVSTTLVSCPSRPSTGPCSGQPVGLLLALTCP